MVNLDTRVLELVNENELWLILHVAKRMQQSRMTAWPSIKTLCADTRWNENTLRKWRKSLCDKGFLKIEQRHAQTPIYTFTLKGIGVFSDFSGEYAEEIPLPKIGTPPSQKLVTPPSQKLVPELVSNRSELTIEGVSNETAPQAAFPSTPPPETEIQNAVTVGGEVGTLEAAVFQNPAGPPPPAGQKSRRAAKAETTTAEILSHLKGEVVDYFHAIHAAWQEWSRYKADEKRSRYKPQGAARTITALFNETGGDAELGREAIRFSMEKNWAGIFTPKQSDRHAAPAQRYSLADRPQCEHTPDGLLSELRAFYTASTGLLCAAQEYAGTKYGANDLKTIIHKFCANQVGKGRCANTFEQHHADLSAWLLNQKRFEQQGPKDNNPYSNRPDVNPYARHKIIS